MVNTNFPWNLWEGFQDIALSNMLDKILLFLLFFVIIYMILEKKIFKEQKTVNTIIATSISLLAVVLMREQEFLKLILVYQIFGVAILFGITIMIFVYFLHKSGTIPLFRKTFLIGYTIILMLFIGENISEENTYMLYILLGIMVCLILFDNKIQEYFMKQ